MEWQILHFKSYFLLSTFNGIADSALCIKWLILRFLWYGWFFTLNHIVDSALLMVGMADSALRIILHFQWYGQFCAMIYMFDSELSLVWLIQHFESCLIQHFPWYGWFSTLNRMFDSALSMIWLTAWLILYILKNYTVDSALSVIQMIPHFQSYSQLSLSFMKQRTEQGIGNKWNNIFLYLTKTTK